MIKDGFDLFGFLKSWWFFLFFSFVYFVFIIWCRKKVL